MPRNRLKLMSDTEIAYKALRTAEAECWTIKCESYPTGAGDADVGWEVISYWQAPPKERVEGRGSTPLKALIDAMEQGERKRRSKHVRR